MPLLIWAGIGLGGLYLIKETGESIEGPLKWAVIGGGVYVAGKYVKAW